MSATDRPDRPPWSAFKEALERAGRSLEALDLDPLRRAETLSLPELRALEREARVDV